MPRATVSTLCWPGFITTCGSPRAFPIFLGQEGVHQGRHSFWVFYEVFGVISIIIVVFRYFYLFIKSHVFLFLCVRVRVADFFAGAA